MFHCTYSLFIKVALLIQYYFLKWKAPDTIIVFVVVVIIVDLEIALTMFFRLLYIFPYQSNYMFARLWMELFYSLFFSYSLIKLLLLSHTSLFTLGY